MDDIITSLLGGAWGVGGAVSFFVLLGVLKATIRTSMPDKLLVVTGRKRKRGGRTFGFSVERGRSVVIPYLQSLGSLDLGVIPVAVRVEGVNSANGITVGADATACVCIDDDDDTMLYSAVERLMGKDNKQIHDQVQQTLVGNFRGALNKATPLQAIGMEDNANDDGPDAAQLGERAQFRAELLKDINSDLRSFGMKVVSVSLQKIWDTSNYIANLAQQTLAGKRRQVEIEEARLRALAAQAESNADRRIQVATSTANESIIAANQELEVFRRTALGEIASAKLTADQRIEEEKNRGESMVQGKTVELRELANKSGITLRADAETQAAAIVAEGQAEATRIREEARNLILRRKAEMLAKFGDDAASVLFLQQKLPSLFAAYSRFASESGKVDSLVVMDEEHGFSNAVNRGPLAFAQFLGAFRDAFGFDVRQFAMPQDKEAGK
jgi:uncharacterized membrane protein YqiK